MNNLDLNRIGGASYAIPPVAEWVKKKMQHTLLEYAMLYLNNQDLELAGRVSHSWVNTVKLFQKKRAEGSKLYKGLECFVKVLTLKQVTFQLQEDSLDVIKGNMKYLTFEHLMLTGQSTMIRKQTKKANKRAVTAIMQLINGPAAISPNQPMVAKKANATFMQCDFLEAALAASTNMLDGRSRNRCLALISMKAVECGDISKTTKVAEMITDPCVLEKLYDGLIEQLLKHYEYAGVLRFFAKVPNGSYRKDKMFSRLAVKAASRKDFDIADDFFKSMSRNFKFLRNGTDLRIEGEKSRFVHAFFDNLGKPDMQPDIRRANEFCEKIAGFITFLFKNLPATLGEKRIKLLSIRDGIEVLTPIYDLKATDKFIKTTEPKVIEILKSLEDKKLDDLKEKCNQFQSFFELSKMHRRIDFAMEEPDEALRIGTLLSVVDESVTKYYFPKIVLYILSKIPSSYQKERDHSFKALAIAAKQNHAQAPDIEALIGVIQDPQVRKKARSEIFPL